jgi:hypothetical protein
MAIPVIGLRLRGRDSDAGAQRAEAQGGCEGELLERDEGTDHQLSPMRCCMTPICARAPERVLRAAFIPRSSRVRGARRTTCAGRENL